MRFKDRRFVINNEANYHGRCDGTYKKLGKLSFSDINKNCVLIETGSRILREKAVAQPLLPGNSEAKSRRSYGYHKCSLVVFLYCIKTCQNQ